MRTPSEREPASGLLHYSASPAMLTGLLTRWTKYDPAQAGRGDPFLGYYKAAGGIGILRSRSFWVSLDGYEEVTDPSCFGEMLVGKSADGSDYEVRLSIIRF